MSWRARASAASSPTSDSGTILYCAGSHWGDVPGTDHHLAQALSQQRRVVWVEPPTPASLLIAAGRWKDAARFRLEETWQSPSFCVVASTGPPWPQRRVTWRAYKLRMDHITRTAARIFTGPVTAMVSAAPMPRAVVAGATSVYFATDDFRAGSELFNVDAGLLMRWEQMQLARSSVQIAVSQHLMNRWPPATGTVRGVIENGCDPLRYQEVERVRARRGPQHGRLVAGLVGQLSDRLDLELLEALLEADVELLIVGPISCNGPSARIRALLSHPRAKWVGRRKYSELPEYFARMDVGLTPYRRTDFNLASVPLKTLEYLAAGLPVAATSCGTPQDGFLVQTADTPADFVRAVRQASRHRQARNFEPLRRQFVAQNSWDQRAGRLLSLIDEHRSHSVTTCQDAS